MFLLSSPPSLLMSSSLLLLMLLPPPLSCPALSPPVAALAPPSRLLVSTALVLQAHLVLPARLALQARLGLQVGGELYRDRRERTKEGSACPGLPIKMRDPASDGGQPTAYFWPLPAAGR